MSEETTTAVEFLQGVGTTVKTIADNLKANRLDRRTIHKLLCDYSARAASDGRLINASRQDPQCVNRGLFLAYTHMELISWLARNNYTISATSIKWYSWRKAFGKYRLPLLSISSQTADLQSQMQHIEKTAGLVHADLQANDIPIPPDSIKYPKVPVGEPAGPPPEAIHDLLHRGTIAHQKLTS
ncbi:glyoxalase family protein [Aspergillus varians]